MTTSRLNDYELLWLDPPENIANDLRDLSGRACSIDCTGRRWQSITQDSVLTINLYREITPLQAVYAISGAAQIYETRRFYTQWEPVDSNTLAVSWMAHKDNQAFILYSQQGFAVVIVSIQTTEPQAPEDIFPLMINYAQTQVNRLELRGFLNPLIEPVSP